MLSIKLFTLVTAIAGLVESWDVAVTTTDRKVHYYANASIVSTSNFEGTELSALAYDAASDLLLLIDELNMTDTIFRILSTNDNDTQPLVRKQNYTLRSVAYDPVTDTIFWIAGGIYSMSLADARSNGYGETVIAHRGTYTGVAVDSCGGYIYWAELALRDSTIKRAKLDGSQPTVIIGSDLFMPVGLAVDHTERRLYWVDDSEGVHYKIESSDLNGNDRRTLASDINQQPKDIAVGDKYVYWSDELQKCIWRTNKSATHDQKPEKFLEYESGATPKGLTVKYDISAQIGGTRHCNALKQTLKRSSTYLSGIIETNLKKRNSDCVHGTVAESGACDCLPRYGGERCEVRSCNLCALDRCNAAEITLCEQLHPTTKMDISTARASTQYASVSNETPKLTSITAATVESKGARNTIYTSSTELLEAGDGEFVESSSCRGEEWDMKDAAIMALGTICGLLSMAVAVLITRIIHLKKRPRIKKRIIVNKNVTPLTARPEQQQCEITIENCCNMNICETPCFEPRSTIRPSLLGAKAGKDEKKNLIANMEHPDDIY